jgi:GNAT superfamily N-acetyltransferase
VSTTITAVESRSDLKSFIRFPHRLYRGNPYWVPPLYSDELDTLSPGRNPAFDEAEARLFLAKRNGTIVGRIAAIISRAANRKYAARNLRFGWFDAVQSREVAKSLLDAAAAWGRGRGMVTMTGPHGFTDLDFEGMLVEGFKERATIATIYNRPYYPRLLEACGFEKEVDFIEFQGFVPVGAGLPERMVRLAEWSAKRNRWSLVKCSSIKELRRNYGQKLFDLLDESYEELYGTVPLTQKQKDYYIGKYLPFARPEMIKIACSPDGEMIGFMIALPSLAGAFQKARGRLFPLGFLHILRGLRKFDSIDFMLAGVRKQYRGKGIDLAMAIDMFRTAVSRGVRVAESNPELESNSRIQGEWKIVPSRQHKRRRIYRKSIA